MKTQYKKSLGGSNLVIHKDSHTIWKEKPKIRIIHIVAPEIIKTDTENFRSVVQKLTGKPLGKSSGNLKKAAAAGKNISSLQRNIKVQSTTSSLQKADHNPNAFLSFLGEGFVHGMNNVNEFPLLQFRSNPHINTFGHIPFF